LIFINPLNQDPRLFFKGKVGISELDFYIGHNQIEQKFEPVINTMIDILKMCDT